MTKITSKEFTLDELMLKLVEGGNFNDFLDIDGKLKYIIVVNNSFESGAETRVFF